MSGTAADGARRHHEEGRMDQPSVLLSPGDAGWDGGARCIALSDASNQGAAGWRLM